MSPYWKSRTDPKMKRKPLSWLKALIHDLSLGTHYLGHDGQKRVVHCNRNERIRKALELRRLGLYSRDSDLQSWSVRKLHDHADSVETYYFCGSHRGYSLLMIDVDCHNGIGTHSDAMRYCKYLRENYFPNLYFEPSTSGTGAHAYVVVNLGELCSDAFKTIAIGQQHVGGLECWLNVRAEGFDIERVEVKGLPPVVEWNSDGTVQRYTAGTLAKLPRGIVGRFDQLKSTTIVPVEDLRRLVSNVAYVRNPNAPVRPEKEENDGRKHGTTAGSISGQHIDADEIDRLLPLAEELLRRYRPVARSGQIVTAMDVAVFLSIGSFFEANPNKDGSQPIDRWRRLWSECYAAGTVDRAWSNQRWTGMRNALVDAGLIDVNSMEYWFFDTRDVADRRRGQACRWGFSVKLMQMIEQGATIYIVTELGEGEASEKKKKESILCSSTFHSDSFIELAITRSCAETRPVFRPPDQTYQYSPDEITNLLAA